MFSQINFFFSMLRNSLCFDIFSFVWINIIVYTLCVIINDASRHISIKISKRERERGGDKTWKKMDKWKRRSSKRNGRNKSFKIVSWFIWVPITQKKGKEENVWDEKRKLYDVVSLIYNSCYSLQHCIEFTGTCTRLCMSIQ